VRRASAAVATGPRSDEQNALCDARRERNILGMVSSEKTRTHTHT
jgi:hypothetical protein